MHKIAHLRFPQSGSRPASLHLLFECHFGRMAARPPSGAPQLLRSALHPTLLQVVNQVQAQELMNQCYAFVSYMTGDVGALLMNLREATANTREGVDPAPRWRIGKLLWDSGIVNNRTIAMTKELAAFMGYTPLLGEYPDDVGRQHRWHVDALQMLLLHPYPGADIPVDAPWDDPKAGGVTFTGEGGWGGDWGLDRKRYKGGGLHSLVTMSVRVAVWVERMPSPVISSYQRVQHVSHLTPPSASPRLRGDGVAVHHS